MGDLAAAVEGVVALLVGGVIFLLFGAVLQQQAMIDLTAWGVLFLVAAILGGLVVTTVGVAAAARGDV